jgi:hypothetical protein
MLRQRLGQYLNATKVKDKYMELVTRAINAENTFTDGVYIKGDFALSLVGTFVSTVTVQRSWNGSDYYDVDTFTSTTESNGYDGVGVMYRVGVKSGDYTSGTVTATIRDNDLSK